MIYIKRFLGKDPTKDRIYLDDIKALIKAGVEENINLDYKEIPDPTKFDSFLNDIAKDVSAFLNSDGGLLILGVAEMRRKVGNRSGKIAAVRILPSKITWGTLTKERLEGSLKGKVHPWNQEILIVPVRKPENDALCIFLVDIPRSKVAPHMADYRFHVRSNFESSPMEYWQVAEMFSRNWTQKRDLVTFVYGPIYNETNLFLRRRKYRQFSITQYNEVLRDHAYLLNLVEWDLVENIHNLYDAISRLNRCLQDAPTIIKKIVDAVVSNFLGLSDKDRPVTVYVDIKADLVNVLPTIDVLILERNTPTEWLREEYPNAKVLSVKYEIRFPDSKIEVLNEEQFKQIIDLSRKEAEKDEVIRFVWEKEDELDGWADELLERLQKLM